MTATITAIATDGPEVTVTAAPNDRVLVTLTGRNWTLIDAYLTNQEVVALHAALVSYGLTTTPEFNVADAA